MKLCRSCLVEKDFSSFNPRGDGCSGYRSNCKACVAIKRKSKFISKRVIPIMTTEEVKIRRKESLKKFREKQSSKAKHAAVQAERRAFKLKATPKWLTPEQVRQTEIIYEMAAELTSWGIGQVDVDHIVPLKGENVCGLHVHWNLQVMDHTLNNRKSNKHG